MFANDALKGEGDEFTGEQGVQGVGDRWFTTCRKPVEINSLLAKRSRRIIRIAHRLKAGNSGLRLKSACRPRVCALLAPHGQTRSAGR